MVTVAKRTGVKEARLDIRTSSEQKELLTRAAQLRQRSVSDFVLESAATEARRVVEEESRLVIPNDDWQVFCEALDASPKCIPQLQRLLKRKSAFER